MCPIARTMPKHYTLKMKLFYDCRLFLNIIFFEAEFNVKL